MEDKIKEINKLNSRIKSLKEFLDICKNGSGDSSYSDGKGGYKRNYFGNLSVKSYRWTGSDNPAYEKNIVNKDDIDLLVDHLIQPTEIQIKKLEKELSDKLN